MNNRFVDSRSSAMQDINCASADRLVTSGWSARWGREREGSCEDSRSVLGVSLWSWSGRVGAIFVMWAALLVGCSSGGSGGGPSDGDGGPPVGDGSMVSEPGQSAAPDNASLIIIPLGDRFDITLDNYVSFVDAANITGITITAVSADNETTILSLNATLLEAGEGSFIWDDLIRGQRYHFSIALLYRNGSRSDIPIVFMRRDNRRDHAKGGIYLGANRDRDGQADAVDDDFDNDGIVDSMDRCWGGLEGWLSDSVTDTDGDGCRDEDEDSILVGVTDLRARAGPTYINLSWTNPPGVLASIRVSWRGSNGVSDSRELRAIPLVVSYRIEDLAREVDWEVELVVTYRNGAKSFATRQIGLFTDTDGDEDGMVDFRDNCPAMANADQSDRDGDGEGDACDADMDGDGYDNERDIDADGDGLIEIGTPVELDAVRYQLNGNGSRLSMDGVLNTTGCGGGEEETGNITVCSGYELTGDIDLSSVSEAGEGWLPLASAGMDTAPEDHQSCNGGGPFNGTFDGNDHVISGLWINRSAENCVGLFGWVAAAAEVRSVHVEAKWIIGNHSVGGLIGHGNGARVSRSSVIFDRIEGSRHVGGLVGQGGAMEVVSVVVRGGSVVGTSSRIGGLIGWGSQAEVRRTEVGVGNISGTTDIGGLLGEGRSADIFSSSVLVDRLDGESRVGGLLGNGISGDVGAAAVGDFDFTRVVSSFVIAGSIDGSGHIDADASRVRGGLMGVSDGTLVVSSYSLVGRVSGNGTAVGGMIGFAMDTEVANSYGVSGSSLNRTVMLGVSSRDNVLHQVYWDGGGRDNQSLSLDSSLDKTSVQLRAPTDYSGIYDGWDTGLSIDGVADSREAAILTGEIDNRTVYCDIDQDGRILGYERQAGNRIWDFGTEEDYPVIRCARDGGQGQRSWWYPDEVGQLRVRSAVFAVDLDSDGDGFVDVRDVFPFDEAEWADRDRDGFGDRMDTCPFLANPDQADVDGDGMGDLCDRDKDNDGFVDESDAFPLDVAEWLDGDNDSVGDHGDNCDGVANGNQTNTDGDSMGDACDGDWDGDDIANELDRFPLDRYEWSDMDNDSSGDNGDNCPLVANGNQTDTDKDGMGDACDRDKDNDGIVNEHELPGCDLKPDCDGDGYRDVVDLFPLNPHLWGDIDRDGIGDGVDKCLLVPSRDQRDTDNDGEGNVCDVDDDGDGYPDVLDVDDDGDGLIEIGTAMELDAVRYQLDGRGRRGSMHGYLNRLGCGGTGGVRDCSGYELVAAIDLAVFSAGEGWLPLGRPGVNETGAGICNGGEAFSGIFEGNDWTVSGLVINRSGEDCVGLFGWVDSGARIDRLHIEAGRIEGRHHVGGLVGHGEGFSVTGSSVVFDRIGGGSQVGGLVGSGEGMALVSSAVLGHAIMGDAHAIGGLVGDGAGAAVRFSEVRLANLSGATAVGGLVGSGRGVDIISSSVLIADIRGERRIGGLIGDGRASASQGVGLTRVISSFTVVDRLFGSGRHSWSDVGGLIGDGTGSVIVSSYAVARAIDGNATHIGGLLGNGSHSEVAYSYVISDTITGSDSTRALIGGGNADVLQAVYWDKDTNGIAATGMAGSSGQTSQALRSPTNYSGIYDDWADGVNIDGVGTTEQVGISLSGVDEISIYCDRDHDGAIGATERQAGNRIWEFGSNTSYPVIRCTRDSGVEQHSWWTLHNLSGLQLNHSFLAVDLDRDGDGYLDVRDLFPLDSSENADGDSDGIGNNKDNCPFVFNVDQADVDFDALGDVCDTDWDNDGVGNADEEAGCELEPDCDGDSYEDGEDAFPADANEWQDSDEDTVGDNSDNCLLVANRDQANGDRDRLGDACDDDWDNDGFVNDEDVFPLNAAEWLDTDGDSIGDNSDNCVLVANRNQTNGDRDRLGDVCDDDWDNDDFVNDEDAFPLNATEWLDTDGDSIGDNSDNCVLVANRDQLNTDGDRLGDVCDDDKDGDGFVNDEDALPLNATEWLDTDGDSIGDNSDNCVLVANRDQLNTDGDSMGDECDEDKDGDGVNNTMDAFPEDRTETMDSDGDRIGDNSDNCLTLANPDQLNTDGDSMGDACDNDKDGDGIDDGSDNCPLIANLDQRDTDGDTMGNACDDDSDNDGVKDHEDIDDDGDGLMEVSTAEEVDMMRWVLNGNGTRRSFTDDSLNTTGCGSSALAEQITACNGYELTQSIDMFDYINTTYGDLGWLPIGGTSYFFSTDPDKLGELSLNGVCSSITFDIDNELEDARFNTVFEGNGHVISGLWIDRPWPDCGGFFGILSGEVRNIGVLIDKIEVSAEEGLGGLAGDASGARIISSYAISRALIGIKDDLFIGGLVGIGENAEIIDSYAVNGLLEMRDGESGGSDDGVVATGGLVGNGKGATIISSYAITDAMIGSPPVINTETVLAGLVGFAEAKIISSYAVAGSMTNSQNVRGFADSDGDIYYSYTVSGRLASVETASNVDWVTAFTGFKENNVDVKTRHSYWDVNTSKVTATISGTSKTTRELQTPTDFSGIYENWDDGFDLDGVGGADDHTIYCDEDGSGSIEDGEKRNDSHSDGDNRIWDFGSSSEYPAIRCTPDTLAEQRAWWYLNSTTNHPQLNRTRLDDWLDGTPP